MSRNFVWLLLIIGGVLAVVVTLVTTTQAIGMAVGALAVCTWICFGYYTAWYHGIRRHVETHLGRHWQLGEVLKHSIRTIDRPNFQLSLDWLQSQSNTVGPFGVRGGGDYDEEGQSGYYVSELVPLIEGNPEPVAIVWERISTSTDETMNCACNAVYLLRVAGEPVCLLVQQRAKGISKRASLQILARTEQIARTALEELTRLSREQSVYRGQVISVERPKDRQTDICVQFHDLGRVEREGIVLPDGVLQSIDRNLLSFFTHAEALRAAGQGTRHGVLLHGPPGTGKTLVTRYLASHAEATVLLVTGRQYAQLRAVCQLARLLTPSLVILEDIDLIAMNRRNNRHTGLLHELLDEMDGLGSASDVVFLLTTNRPEVLEPALAARPGRIDQAIYFPLPDLECRRRLFAEFSQKLDVSAVNLEVFLPRTEGASPAFLKEMFRRATLMAIERGANGDPLPLVTEDFERGLRELLQTGGTLTRNFLGFPATT